MMAVCHT